MLNVACAMLGLALLGRAEGNVLSEPPAVIAARFNEAVHSLPPSGIVIYLPLGYIGRARFHRARGNFVAAERDLGEAEEIAESGSMRLHLCDIAIERARLALAEGEAFAPLADVPSTAVADPGVLLVVAGEHLTIAQKIVSEYSYHRRDAECAELAAVIAGERRFADLPPRVS